MTIIFSHYTYLTKNAFLFVHLKKLKFHFNLSLVRISIVILELYNQNSINKTIFKTFLTSIGVVTFFVG